ncbi:papain cysteine protease family protein [Russula earlei]|uniref:Papain cysteine protease family protein n=1 Tax=Russula earlei TaxID=71964 RepID=A0ACC0U3I5_9AGAM|nr:papain cysteine protease family protein [Russula earlei]
MLNKVSWYGWQPDVPDQRDLTYAAPRAVLKTLPAKVDLRKNCPPVYDQGQLGSCTANAIGGAFQFELMKQKAKAVFAPSRLFIYYNERVIENTVGSDAGAQIRDGIKSVNQKGVCPETQWPYDVNQFTKAPPAAAYTDALTHQVTSYHRVDRNLAQMKGCLADGYPFVVGFTVYESFEGPVVAKTGKLNMPAANEQQVGGHAVLVVGYDDSAKRFIVRNSWGADWALKGYFTMPYDYLMNANLSDDFWTIRLIEDSPAVAQPVKKTAKKVVKKVAKKAAKQSKK